MLKKKQKEEQLFLMNERKFSPDAELETKTHKRVAEIICENYDMLKYNVFNETVKSLGSKESKIEDLKIARETSLTINNFYDNTYKYINTMNYYSEQINDDENLLAFTYLDVIFQNKKCVKMIQKALDELNKECCKQLNELLADIVVY